MNPAATLLPHDPTSMASVELRQAALGAILVADPVHKAAATQAIAAAVLPVDTAARLQPPPGRSVPGRPARPRCVAPQALARRSAFTVDGRAALLHAVAHIEFNAIDLALDAVWRFAGMPEAYYRDWVQVAADEARHFGLLVAHLRTLDRAYGDFDAHDGLWTMAERTAGDATARMGLVPRLLEARGLDATPAMQARLRQAGDEQAAAILQTILDDEIGHVAVGNRWFRWLCARDGLDPVHHAAELALRHGAPRLRAPINAAARRAAGFTEAEVDAAQRDAAR